METHSLYVCCAFLTKGSVYASERSALNRRGQAISWHSYSKMGVSCLQQHVWISPPRGSTQRTGKDTTSHHRQAATVKADILFPFSSYYPGSFLSGCPHIRNKMPGTSSSSPAQIHCYFTAAPRWKADRGTHSSGGPAAGETDWTESGSPGLGFLLLFGVEAATGAVGSLSNWVEPETGSTHQQRPRWSFLLRGRNTVCKHGRSSS